MFKNLTIKIIFIVSLISLLFISLLFLYQSNLKEIEKVTFEYFKTGDERRGGLVIQNSLKENLNTKDSGSKLITNLMISIFSGIYQFERDCKNCIGYQSIYL